ncbi:MAG: Grx4 family monothiol glutaredoxin [Hydrogenophilales bacterium]|tara:strand:- start:271 stop:576 length:306 start_codon:yes stop_codon:yes gene_type:complete
MTINDRISSQIKDNKIVLYMKGTPDAPMCGFSATVVQILEACGVEDVATVNVLEDDEIRQGIKDFSNWPTIPQLYVDGEFVGGADILKEMYQAGELQELLK